MWEYKVVGVGLHDETKLERVLAEHGAAGWELVAIPVMRAATVNAYGTLIFKRAVVAWPAPASA